MKIKKSLVEQIIKEEAVKIKKLIVLKEEKKQIIKQLNELYENDQFEENAFSDAGNWLKKGAQKVVRGVQKAYGAVLSSREEALEVIHYEGHEAQLRTYNGWLKKDPKVAEKFLDFIIENPNVKNVMYVKGEFVNADHEHNANTAGYSQPVMEGQSLEEADIKSILGVLPAEYRAPLTTALTQPAKQPVVEQASPQMSKAQASIQNAKAKNPKGFEMEKNNLMKLAGKNPVDISKAILNQFPELKNPNALEEVAEKTTTIAERIPGILSKVATGLGVISASGFVATFINQMAKDYTSALTQPMAVGAAIVGGTAIVVAGISALIKGIQES